MPSSSGEPARVAGMADTVAPMVQQLAQRQDEMVRAMALPTFRHLAQVQDLVSNLITRLDGHDLDRRFEDVQHPDAAHHAEVAALVACVCLLLLLAFDLSWRSAAGREVVGDVAETYSMYLEWIGLLIARWPAVGGAFAVLDVAGLVLRVARHRPETGG